MNALLLATIAAVAVAGTATALVRDPVRQAVVAGVFGLSLALLFFAHQAPDVALSELVVATFLLPVMIVLTLAKVREEREQEEGSEEEDGS